MLPERFHIGTGSQIFKMAAVKSEVLLPQLHYKIAIKFPEANPMLLVLRNLMALLGRLHTETGSEKFMIVTVKTGCTFIAASVQDIKVACFLGSGKSVALFEKLRLQTGSEEFKTAEPNRKYLCLRVFT
jgi:hypothetical protein